MRISKARHSRGSTAVVWRRSAKVGVRRSTTPVGIRMIGRSLFYRPVKNRDGKFGKPQKRSAFGGPVGNYFWRGWEIEVAFFAASAVGVPPGATITSTLRPTRSASAKFTMRFRMGRARNLKPPAPRRSPAAAPPNQESAARCSTRYS